MKKKKIKVPVDVQFARTRMIDDTKYCELVVNGELLILPAIPEHKVRVLVDFDVEIDDGD